MKQKYISKTWFKEHCDGLDVVSEIIYQKGRVIVVELKWMASGMYQTIRHDFSAKEIPVEKLDQRFKLCREPE